MDLNFLASAGVGTSTLTVLFIAYKVFQALRGKRFVSRCCGARGDIGFDVRPMPQSVSPDTPTHQHSVGTFPPPPPTEARAVLDVPRGTPTVVVPEEPEENQTRVSVLTH